ANDKIMTANNILKVIPDLTRKLSDYIAFKKNKIDIIIAFGSVSGIAASILKKKLKIPFIFVPESFTYNSMLDIKINSKNCDQLIKRNNWHLQHSAETVSILFCDSIIVPISEKKADQIFSSKLYKEIYGKINNLTKINYGVNADNYGIEKFKNHYKNNDGKLELINLIKSRINLERSELPFIITDISQKNNDNAFNLIKIYNSSKELQKSANLMIIGKIDSKRLITNLKKNNLEGKLCVLKYSNYYNELPYIFGYCAEKRSIFVNFDSTENNISVLSNLMTAMASGIAVITAKNESISELLDFNRYGLMFVAQKQSLKNILYFINKKELFDTYREKSVKRIIVNYSWNVIAKKYLRIIESIEKKGNACVQDISIPNYFVKQSKQDDEQNIKSAFKNILVNNNFQL
ncbi:glycosyltransferase, partial [Candidatus Dependentiae bacterium]|nr:glycosyltransferase [Candidatus Dependentiae bacterium]